MPLHSGVCGIGVISQDPSVHRKALCMHLEYTKLRPSSVDMVLSVMMDMRLSEGAGVDPDTA